MKSESLYFVAGRLRFRGSLVTACIAVSFLVMIIAVAVSSGFRHEIRAGLSGMTGDVQIVSVNAGRFGEASPIPRCPDYLGRIAAMDGVDAVRPAVYRAGIVKRDTDIQGVVFKGLEDDPALEASLDVSIPERLSKILSLDPGDEMPAYFVGETVRFRKFRVVSVHGNGVADSNMGMVVRARLDDMQRLNGWDGNSVSALEVIAEKKDAAGLEALSRKIGYEIYSDTAEGDGRVAASSVLSRYPQLFDWLELIDFNVLFILLLMTAVAGFNMISGLLIMLFEHISTIGLLKAMGMTDKEVARIFLVKASSCVLRGMAIGNLLAFAFCLIQGATHLIGLNPDNYFVSFVPVRIDVLKVLAADAAVYAAIMLLLLIPSRFISGIDPAESIAMR